MWRAMFRTLEMSRHGRGWRFEERQLVAAPLDAAEERVNLRARWVFIVQGGGK